MKGRWLIVCAAALCMLVGDSHALAADDDAAAEALFQEGRRLMAEGKVPLACRKLEASRALQKGYGVTLNLAECYLLMGRTASAWLTFREAASLARSHADEGRETFARGRARAVEPLVRRLTIEATPEKDAVDFRVFRNDVEVLAELFGVPVPVDPGSYEIRAVARGFRPLTQTITIDGPPGHTSVVRVGRLVRAEAPSAPSTSASTSPSMLMVPVPAPRPVLGVGRGIALGLGGAAVIATGIGIYLVTEATRMRDESRGYCGPSGCLPVGSTLLEDAGRSADLATGMFVSASAMGLAAVLTWVLCPPKVHGAARAELYAAPREIGIRGTF